MTEPRPRARRTKATAPTPDAGAPKPAAKSKPAAKPKAAPKPNAAPKRPASTKPRRPRAKPPAAEVATAAEPETRATPEVAESSGPRRVWVSGATGFVGKAIVRVLRTRGDEVIAPVRDPRRAADLVEMGVTVIEDDLSDVALITEQMRDVDAAIHSAGTYRVGIGREERGAMWDANIGTTTRVLDAAEAAKTPKVVYVSTVGVFGNTHGQIVDETYRRNVRDGFLSWYDETKYGAHEVAAQRARAGAPIVTVQPSQVYGPGDYTEIGNQLRLAHAGKLPYRAFEDVGLGFVYVDDLAVGIVAALDRGSVPAAYVLSGPRHRLGEALAVAARLGGKRLPRLRLPNIVLRLAAPIGGRIGQPNLREVVSASAGVTYWASADKAARELGFAPRSLEDGLRDMFEYEADAAYTRS
jgi:dihydroflavonol-4-reductase